MAVSNIDAAQSPDAVQAAPRERTLFAVGLSLIVLAASVALSKPILSLFRVVSRSYNEGWNAFWADAAFHHRVLYGPADSLVSNNYPPLSFELIGLLGRLFGDNVIAGRLVSLASFIVMILACYAWLRAVGAARQIALAGAAMLLFSFSWYGNAYVAMNDPQLLAHAFMLSAVVVLWRFDFETRAIAAAAALVILGGFTKHLLIPLPLAITLWLAIYRRDRLHIWIACFAAGLPIGFALTTHLYGWLFFQDLMSARLYSAENAWTKTLSTCMRFLPLLLLAAVLPINAWRRRAHGPMAPRAVFALMYLVLSLGIGAVAVGGEGVMRNAFFDFLVASCLCAALGLEALRRTGVVNAERPAQPGKATPAAVVVMILGVGVALFAATSIPQTVRSVRELDALEQDTRATVQMIQRLGKGRAACETLALCYWARGDFTMDFFNYGQKLQTGAVPVSSCTEALERGDFPVLQLEPAHMHSGDRLWPCSPAIERFYTVAYRSSVGTLLVPKEPAGG